MSSPCINLCPCEQGQDLWAHSQIWPVTRAARLSMHHHDVLVNVDGKYVSAAGYRPGPHVSVPDLVKAFEDLTESPRFISGDRLMWFGRC